MNINASTAVAILAIAGLAGSAFAQSQTASDASALSMYLSVETSVSTLERIPSGSELIVSALRPMGELVAVTLSSAATGASFVVNVSATVVSAAAVTTGSAIVVSATGAGWLILAGSEAIAFVPNAIARSLVGHRALS